MNAFPAPFFKFCLGSVVFAALLHGSCGCRGSCSSLFSCFFLVTCFFCIHATILIDERDLDQHEVFSCLRALLVLIFPAHSWFSSLDLVVNERAVCKR